MNMYGVEVGLPYEKWPNEALARLQADLGRNGPTSTSEELGKKVAAELDERNRAGVVISKEGQMELRV